ncbi:hypothetical protein EPUS_02365 [Endocarpon pusillum Z07020]|uniref:Uncharacterized protein n=1 Tax=Endocarpon pusillum (strain Z07020 / HMAS-L-300199) TaxID=1263415 RepID=U1GFG1_ENDPU|nr:uncharacterized protein EPUS_02365 [Endocarpon pusillum Z07020]ERF70843.1 hypothetical protein EPUS_02365 [Endocarpon pusillum Z07020]
MDASEAMDPKGPEKKQKLEPSIKSVDMVYWPRTRFIARSLTTKERRHAARSN